ncbi:MAG: nucleoside triphosphate pyrophosphohydrolase [Anaerolineales bacterium]|nr:nucleoside triphosphate pyrophosphohydrolase [Anaerolineales bacterium]
MGTVTIVGLGPGDARHLTREAWTVLEEGRDLWLRTAHHPTVAALPTHLTVYAFDSLYESVEDFSQVYAAVADQVLQLAQRPEGVIYAVPGHPFVGETTVKLIVERAAGAGLSVRVVEGLSFIEPVLTALRLDALAGLQVFDALELATCNHPPLNADVPALVGQLYDRRLAADVKLALMNEYPDEHPVTLIHAAGTPEARTVTVPLYEMDWQDDIAHLTALFIPPLASVSGFAAFQDTVARLRAPDGCPWDREQTHESLRATLLEETYEVAAAIDAGDIADLEEELGDLLLQIVLHTQIAIEDGEFQMPDVIRGIDAKLKRRHPHVWGERSVTGTGEVLQRWEELKREEKGDVERSMLDSVPAALPALLQADVYSQRVARVGFDWADLAGVAAKVREEIAELDAAETPEEREAELGDLLFAAVNWARWLGVEAETALRKANMRFASRFRRMEKAARERTLNLGDLTPAELDVLWQQAKRDEEAA